MSGSGASSEQQRPATGISVPVNVPECLRGACLSIGNFDGVHRGHASILQTLIELGRDRGVSTVAVTFDPHPLSLLRPDSVPPVLTIMEDRKALLRAAGVHDVVVLPVTRDLLSLTARQFFDDVIRGNFAASGIVEGSNFHFGRDRGGDIEFLRSLCGSHGMEFRTAPTISDAVSLISSSRIRELLTGGRLKEAVWLLGHPYRLRGVVEHGAHRGRTIGFPTANLGQIPVVVPGHGVYAGRCRLEGKSFPVAVSIGPNPTFAEHDSKVECHVAGFSGNLYGRSFSVDLIAEVRPLRKFDSADQLVSQIRTDVEQCVRTVTEAG